ncbi:MAG: hypothetical protein ABFS32_19565 [Bacteroidota bacterium]
MSAAYIELLQKRIDGLAEKDYDLEVWKNGTALLLSRIYGEGNPYTREVEALKVDFSSWSLRDATSDYNPKETCKRLGREILELSIAELQLPTQEEKAKQTITNMLQDKSGKFAEAIAQKDEQAMLDLLKKENKEYLAGLLVKLLVE